MIGKQPDHVSPNLEPPPPNGAEWRQAHWAFIVIGALRNMRGWIVPLAIVAVTQGVSGSRADYVWYGLASLATIGAGGSSLVEWWMYRYRVTDRDITLKSGIVSKQERVIPFERIQSVDLSEAPLERLFKVMRVKVETGAGGSSEAEIEVRALNRDDASELRSKLLAARQRLRGDRVAVRDGAPIDDQASVAAASDALGDGQLIRKISTKELLIAGATSGRIGAAAAIAAALAQFGEQLMPGSLWERLPWDGFVDAASNIQIVLGVVGFLGLIAWLISIATTVMTYGGFELRRAGDQLQVRYGLLDRRRTTIPIRRIQAIRVIEGLFRQPFGYAEIRFDSAGFGADQGASGVLSPLLPKREVLALLQETCPDFATVLNPGTLKRLPPRARRRYIVSASIGWVIMIGIAAGVTWRFFDFPVWWVLSLLIVTPLFAVFGDLRYRDAGWYVDRGSFLLRWRGVSRVTVITQVRRLQHRRLQSDPFQRRSDLVTFRTAVASGGSLEGFSLLHLDARDGEVLTEQLGGALPWETSPRRSPRAATPVDIDFGLT
jgi:putative membrane protein